MKTFTIFIAGLIAGMWLAGQTKALHMPTFHIPRSISIDPVVILLAVIVVLAIMAARGKHNPRRAGK